ncbi:hypothetical protein LCGC14_2621880 [marine sediment metagenome]|uniref:CR-type domain-containing protein n=1 Tax=marine sediment metagenome TaxID=412755 RepID=A0A0F9CVF8_9ZZZZ
MDTRIELTDLQQAQQTVAEKFYVEEECTFCSGTGYTKEPLSGSGQFSEPGAQYLCGLCNGTGKVRRGPMRVVCTTCQGRIIEEPYRHLTCAPCGNLGYTPCEDAMVLLEALQEGTWLLYMEWEGKMWKVVIQNLPHVWNYNLTLALFLAAAKYVEGLCTPVEGAP